MAANPHEARHKPDRASETACRARFEPGTLECTVVAATLKVLKCTKLLATFMTGMN